MIDLSGINIFSPKYNVVGKYEVCETYMKCK